MSIFSDYVERKKKKDISVKDWLKKAAKNSREIKFATNIGKYTNPDIPYKISINAKEYCKNSVEGYVSTADLQDDNMDAVYRSASVMTPAGILLLKLEDGKSVYFHLMENTDFIRDEFIKGFDFSSEEYEDIRHEFLMIDEANSIEETSSLLSQVYFPDEEDEYHLLSVFNSSSMANAIFNKVNSMRQDMFESRNKDSEKAYVPYSAIKKITQVKIGGTQPQNVSQLNNNNLGRVFLLNNLPRPLFKKEEMQLPYGDFFKYVKYKIDEKVFWEFHNGWLAAGYKRADKNNKIVETYTLQKNRINLVMTVIDQILEQAAILRTLEPGWSANKNLSVNQQKWLDPNYEDNDIKLTKEPDNSMSDLLLEYGFKQNDNVVSNEEDKTNEWKVYIVDEIIDYFISNYKMICKKRCVKIEDEFIAVLKKRVAEKL